MPNLMPDSTHLTEAEWKTCRRAYNSEQTVLLIALPDKVAVFTRQMDLIEVFDPSFFLDPGFITDCLQKHKMAAQLRDLNDRAFAAQLRRTRIAEDNPNPTSGIPRSRGSQAISIDLELEL